MCLAVLARDKAFFLPLILVCQNPLLGSSCVSEPPTRGFLCVRTPDTLNLFLERGNPLKKWPHIKQKVGDRLLYINYLCKELHHMGIEKCMLINHQSQIMVKSLVFISSTLAPSSRIQNLFGHMTPSSCHCHMTLPLW